MVSFCRHQTYKKIDWIKAPKWSTNEVLISTEAVTDSQEHFLLQFSEDSPKQKFGWFYLSGKVIRASQKQANGRGQVYVVSLHKREEFSPQKECDHQW